MASSFTITSRSYGKDSVRLLRVRREGGVHHISEIRVRVELSLRSERDYRYGDNGDVVPTDTTKNTIYALSKIHGVKDVETFGMLLCKHFIDTYAQVVSSSAYLEQTPWQRITSTGAPHAHAFVLVPECTRFAEVSLKRGGMLCVFGGLHGLRLLKTTQSGFEGFHKDKWTTLPETVDRCFSTQVFAKYAFSRTEGVDFDAAWLAVKNAILDNFAGPPDRGLYSASVQKTMYDACTLALRKVPELCNVSMEMPNIHYFPVDLAKLKLSNHNELFQPSDEPRGLIKVSVSPSRSKL